MSNSTTKQCNKCGNTERYKDGRCAPCVRECNRKWRAANPEYQREWRKSNLEKAREHSRKYRQRSPEKIRKANRKYRQDNLGKTRKYNHKYYQANSKKMRAVKSIWQQANPEKVRRYQRKYQQANPEKAREHNRKWKRANPEYGRKWRAANPEKERASKQRRRAHKQNNISEPYDFKAICDYYDNRCVCCGEKKPLTVDHILPVSKSGPNIASNIQPLCGRCNSIKGTKNIDYRPDAGPERWIQKELLC